MDEDAWPQVSVVMPVVDEAGHLGDAIAAVLAQDYPGLLEVVVAIGPSSDDTERVAAAIARDEPRVTVVHNPAGTTPAGLNAAIAASRGEVVARVDGHAMLAPGYLRRAVELLDATGADNVGGVQRAVGHTPMQQAIAAAMTSRFGVGDARFHYGGAPGPVDTVYLGVFRREALARVGGFDETLERNQDYELNVRLRDAGGVVWFDPGLRVDYRPRPTIRALTRQYHEYGRWKRVVVRAAPSSLRWRQVVPPLTVLATLGGLVAGLTGRRRALALPTAYLVSTMVASACVRDAPLGVRLRLPAVFAAMHHAWGLGFLRGAERRPEPSARPQVDSR